MGICVARAAVLRCCVQVDMTEWARCEAEVLILAAGCPRLES
jgi:hypothetical protein